MSRSSDPKPNAINAFNTFCAFWIFGSIQTSRSAEHCISKNCILAESALVHQGAPQMFWFASKGYLLAGLRSYIF